MASKAKRGPGGRFVKKQSAVGSRQKAVAAEAPPAWVADLAKAIVDGVGALLGRPVITGNLDALGGLQKNGHAAEALPPGHQWLRCEVCYEKYVGVKQPFGSPNLCVDCGTPGPRRKCRSCRKVVKGIAQDVPDNAVICRNCAKCVLCGTKEHGFICQHCVEQGAQTCNGCLRPPMPGSSWCGTCKSALDGQVVDPKGGQRFPENGAPAGNLVGADGQLVDGLGTYSPPSSAAPIAPTRTVGPAGGAIFMGINPDTKQPIYAG